MLMEVVTNKIFLAGLIAGPGIQIIKILLLWISSGRFEKRYLTISGGMPSSHAALVTSVTTMIYLQDGATATFMLALMVTLIVLRDSIGVRRTVGEEARFIKRISQKVGVKPLRKIHYSYGHNPLEIAVGGLLGIIISLLIF